MWRSHTFDPVSAVLVRQEEAPELCTVRQLPTVLGEKKKTDLELIEQLQPKYTYCTVQTPEAHC